MVPCTCTSSKACVGCSMHSSVWAGSALASLVDVQVFSIDKSGRIIIMLCHMGHALQGQQQGTHALLMEKITTHCMAATSKWLETVLQLAWEDIVTGRAPCEV